MAMHNPPHPGEILKELYLDPLNLSISEVAKGIGVSRKSLSEVINGKFGISPGMAIRLAAAFSTTPESWLNLQQQFDLWKEEKKHKKLKVTVFIQDDDKNH